MLQYFVVALIQLSVFLSPPKTDQISIPCGGKVVLGPEIFLESVSGGPYKLSTENSETTIESLCKEGGGEVIVVISEEHF